MGVDQKPKQVGRIVSVKTHNGVPLVSVQLGHAGGSVDNVPVGKAAPGIQITPEKGWMVVVDYLDDGSPFISDVVSAPEFSIPDLNEGSFTFRFNTDTAITVEKQTDGSYNIDIEADGDIFISGANTVEVDGTSIDLGPNGSPVVTDVETTKDADGKVTDVTTTKTSKTTAE